MTLTIALILFVTWATMTALTVFGTYLGLQHFKGGFQIGQNVPAADLPGVSILKPLKGIENNMRENLTGFFALDYPEYEMIFSVADPNDPACEVVRELMRAHPHVSASLIVGDVEVGPNPKVNNLIWSYRAARHDHILISDASTTADPGFLRRIVAHLDGDTGLVTAAGTGYRASGLGGHLETTFLNTFYPRWMLIANHFGVPTVVGHTMLFKKSTADRFGGIRNLARYLAEDYMSGQAMRQLGLKVKILKDPVLRVIGHQKFQGFWSRHLRWGRMRKYHVPLILLFEPLCFPIPAGILGALGAHAAFGFSPVAFFALHMAIWFLCDLILMVRIRSEIRLATPLHWLLRETLAVPHWVHIWAGSTVNWRGTFLKLQQGGVVSEAQLAALNQRA